jgi:hypothetical protein
MAVRAAVRFSALGDIAGISHHIFNKGINESFKAVADQFC